MSTTYDIFDHRVDEMSEIIIRQAHALDDLCIENAALRQALSEVERLLSDVGHMIEHNQTSVAVEYVDRARLAVSKGLRARQVTLKSSGPQEEKENI